MSDTKFTPGPWHMEPSQSEGRIYEFEVRGAANEKQPFGAVTASCSFQTERNIAFDDIETAEANARLIAAAPDMYETLSVIASFAVGHGDVCEIIAQRARAALRKADGEQS